MAELSDTCNEGSRKPCQGAGEERTLLNVIPGSWGCYIHHWKYPGWAWHRESQSGRKISPKRQFSRLKGYLMLPPLQIFKNMPCNTTRPTKQLTLPCLLLPKHLVQTPPMSQAASACQLLQQEKMTHLTTRSIVWMQTLSLTCMLLCPSSSATISTPAWEEEAHGRRKAA